MGYILNAISPTDFILGTKVQPEGALNDPSADNIDQRSRSNFPKNW